MPKKNRRVCIFKESCSKYVFRITNRWGFKKGILALKKRRRICRNGYYFINDQKVRLIDNTIVLASCLSNGEKQQQNLRKTTKRIEENTESFSNQKRIFVSSH